MLHFQVCSMPSFFDILGLGSQEGSSKNVLQTPTTDPAPGKLQCLERLITIATVDFSVRHRGDTQHIAPQLSELYECMLLHSSEDFQKLKVHMY